MKKEDKAVCIILNYNSAELVKELVNNIQNFNSFKDILIVDNKSTDDSYQFLKDEYANNDKVIIEVINDDEAIPEDKIQVIFDKFTKVNNSLNRPSEGSGLGLYLTKRLVELHGGEISISTGKEYNNTFKIVFPYEKFTEKTIPLQSKDINKLQKKIDIEFSDIYF